MKMMMMKKEREIKKKMYSSSYLKVKHVGKYTMFVCGREEIRMCDLIQ